MADLPEDVLLHILSRTDIDTCLSARLLSRGVSELMANRIHGLTGDVARSTFPLQDRIVITRPQPAKSGLYLRRLEELRHAQLAALLLECRGYAERRVTFDFTGTGKETFNCLDAPLAIAHSPIIYNLRCLIGVDIPLNQGCFAPIKVIIPEGTVLNPSGYAAGCCNIILFGTGGQDEHGVEKLGFGLDETIWGGSGAGPGWHGTSGVHIHMTNTRITDCEVYELRYPIILRQFSIRDGSGVRGKWHGGDGVIREIEFRMPLSVSMLGERRVFRPYGFEGGEADQVGLKLYVKKEADGKERVINIGGKMELEVQPGERILIHTPGGGAWGALDSIPDEQTTTNGLTPAAFKPRGSLVDWSHEAASAS